MNSAALKTVPAIFALVAALMGCSPNSQHHELLKANSEAGLFGESGLQPKLLQKISVLTAEGQPLAGAEILIGSGVNDPFVGNVLTTDQAGEVVLPTEWTNEQPVTIDAPSYLRVTFLHRAPQSFVHRMKKIEFEGKHELKGKTLNHIVRDFDGFADFGLIFKALRKEDLFNLQMTSIMSPETDTITIAGFQVELPSNLTLPRQKERYLLIPVTLNKPDFRFYFERPGDYLLMGAKGRFPFTDVVKQMQSGGPMHKLLNKFEFLGGAVKTVNILGPSAVVDFDVAQMTFSQSNLVRFPAPGAGRSILGGRLMEWSEGLFLPTDLKLVEAAGEVKLLRGPDRPHHLVGILKNDNEFEEKDGNIDRLSAALVPDTTMPDFAFLSLLDNPVGSDLTAMKLPAVTIPFTPAELIVYASVGKVIETLTESNEIFKTYLKAWEVYSPRMETEIVLPNWKPMTKDGLYRWEAMYAVAREASLTRVRGSLENMSHVTRSSVDF